MPLGTLSYLVVSCGALWYLAVLGDTWYLVVLRGTSVSCDTWWYLALGRLAVLRGTLWYFVVPGGDLWYHIIRRGTFVVLLWYLAVLSGTLWYFAVLLWYLVGLLRGTFVVPYLVACCVAEPCFGAKTAVVGCAFPCEGLALGSLWDTFV